MTLVLDLYCRAGGAGRGFKQAGCHVVGVDIVDQPRYAGDVFVLGDALDYLATADLTQFDLVWSSPPCQFYTSLRHAPGKHRDADLIALTREALIKTGKPWVIENVEAAGPWLRNPIMLCGSMFGLETHPYPHGWRLERHRLFEASFPIRAPEHRHDDRPTIGIYGGHFRDRRRAKGMNHRSGSNIPRELGFRAMGIPLGTMTVAEISDAIPPIYAQWIVEQWLQQEKEKEEMMKRKKTYSNNVDRVNARLAIDFASALGMTGIPARDRDGDVIALDEAGDIVAVGPVDESTPESAPANRAAT
jgi:DNA (cytosine-5)-methyltransferase 1